MLYLNGRSLRQVVLMLHISIIVQIKFLIKLLLYKTETLRC